jgi:hypothetical protein
LTTFAVAALVLGAAAAVPIAGWRHAHRRAAPVPLFHTASMSSFSKLASAITLRHGDLGSPAAPSTHHPESLRDGRLLASTASAKPFDHLTVERH